MKIILSPAKRFKTSKVKVKDQLLFKKESEILVDKLKELTWQEIANEFKLNDQLAMKAYYDYKEFDFNKLNNPAIFCYDGLVFKQFDEDDFKNIQYLNDNVRILSALYGILTPLTGIRDYRLEMGSSFIDLYEFWQDKIYKKLFENDELVINLASKEYSKVIEKYLKKEDKYITINFKDKRNGKYRSVVAWTKEQRGKMVKYLINNKIEDIDKIKSYSDDGYIYNPYLSKKDELVFSRG